MTLARTALRLAAINALQGADAASGPTVANNRVYDSRIGDFDPESFPDDAKPTIVVLTDSEEGEQLARGNGGPPFRRMVDLVFEFGIVQKVRDDVSADLIYPQTDAQLEAALDVLEFQIARRLGYDPDASGVLFRRIARPVKYECHRQVADDAGVKIACRILTWTCDIQDDQIIVHNEKKTLPVGWNALPEPLRSVAIALPDTSSGFKICVAMAKTLTALQLPSLDDFVITAALRDLTDMNFAAEILSGLDVPQIVASGINGQIDYQKGITGSIDKSYQKLSLDQTVASLTIVGWPRFGIDAKLILEITNAGAFAINGWPTGTVWVGGAPPTITTGAGKRDIVVLTSPDGGDTIFGNIVGQDYR